MNDLQLIRRAGKSKLDATVGSALDIFGGTGCTYEEVVAFHRQVAE
jgi:phosphoribosylformimino-5-aminoimidazole carboxamide ribotide isomerase